MVDAPLKAVFFDFDGVICQTEVCRMDVLEARLHALGLYPDRRKLYRMISGGFRPREAAMDELFGSQPLYWKQREKVLERHPIQFRYPQILTPGITEVTEMLCRAGLQLAVVSNSSTEVVDQALHQCGIRENFRHIFFRLGTTRPQTRTGPLPAGYDVFWAEGRKLSGCGGLTGGNPCRKTGRAPGGSPAGPGWSD